MDWEGWRYVGLTLDWDYNTKQMHISMPGYVAKALKQFHHPQPKHPQNQPFPHISTKYGQKIQYAEREDTRPLLNKGDKKFIQEVVGIFLFYAHAHSP